MGAYIDGSRENLDTMDKMLLNLEQNPSNLEAVEEIFRAAHTLKGMSATMGFEKIAHLTHEMENILDKLRNQEIPVTTEVIDVIFETFDVLRTLVSDSIEQTDSGIDLSEISAKLTALGTGQPVSGAAPQAAAPAATPAAAAAAPQATGGVAADLAQLALNDFEISGAEDAKEKGQMLILLKVSLVDDCLLKGPRIFMVLRTLDDLECDIIKANPEVKDLENEKFDKSFIMLIASDHSPEEISDGVESISEISIVETIPVDFSALSGGEAASAAPVQPAPATPVAPAVSTPTAPAAPVAPPPAPAAPAAPSAPAAPVIPPAPQQSNLEHSIGGGGVIVPPGGGEPPEGDGEDEEEGEEIKEAIELVQLVTFNMAGETYALEIKQVEAIINLVPITRVPKAPKHIDGVINLRGEIVPVINTRFRLKLPQIERSPANQIIILAFETEKVKCGLLVDSVNEVIRLPETSIEPPSRVSEGVDIEYLKGVGKIESQIIILLNAQRIVFGKKTEE